MLQLIQQTVAMLGSWTFVLVSVVLFFESSAFLGLVLPGESLVMVTGVLSGFHLLNRWAALISVVVPVVLGDCAGFLLGSYYGEALLSKSELASHYYSKHRERIESLFRDWGAWTIVVGRFMAVGRAFTPFAAGLSKMPAGRFVAMAAVSAVLWGGGFFAAGYFFGSHFDTLRHLAEFIGIGMFALIAVTFGMGTLWNWLSKRRDELTEVWQRRVVEPLWSRYGKTISRVTTFVRARLSPAGYLGVHITIGIVATVTLGIVFGMLARALVRRAPIVRIDWLVYDFVAAHHTAVLDAVMAAFATASNFWLLLAISLAVAAWFSYRRMPIFAFVSMLVFAGSWDLAIGLEHIFAGTVPNLGWAGFEQTGDTFPNLSMAQATAVYGLVWYAGALELKNWRMQMLNGVAVFYLIFLIGVANMYAGHAMSSVIGGFALGGCWLAICITAGRAWRRLKSYSTQSPQPSVQAVSVKP